VFATELRDAPAALPSLVQNYFLYNPEPMARRVLVVEDNEDLRHLFVDALTVAGFQVSQASDGLQALRQIDAFRPDLVVLDLRLPYFTGMEVRQDLASNLATRRIPVVVVSGSPEDLGNLPVDCVLKKPVYPDTLVSVVQRCLATYKQS
jgi:twitching motility two-component system response regulator PilH